MNSISKFFIMCSGCSESILKRSPSDTNKFIGIGATIFFTGLLAALSGGYAMYVVFGHLIPALIFGIVWGLMIFNLDRFIVSSMKKTGTPMNQFLMATPRLMLATLIALVIAVPLELRIFQKEIQKELVVIQNEELQKNRLMVDSLFQLSTMDLRQQIAGYQNLVMEKDSIFQQRQKEFDYERFGTATDRTSGNAGYGPLAKEKEQQMKEADRERKKTAVLVQPKLNELQEELQQKLDEENAKFEKDSQFIDNYNGIASQMQALKRLEKEVPIIGTAVLFVTLLFLALETAPVFVKLLIPRGPYDDRLHYIEHQSRYNYKNKELDTENEFAIDNIKRKQKLNYYLTEES